jgi:hypothetical protein
VPPTNAVETIQGKRGRRDSRAARAAGQRHNVQLRSPTSISKGNAPLIVVDGVILSQSFDASTPTSRRSTSRASRW